jgi:hypothetical protein
MAYFTEKNLEFWLNTVNKYSKYNNQIYAKYIFDTLTRYIIYSEITVDQLNVMKSFYKSNKLQKRYDYLVTEYKLNNVMKYSENCRLYLIKAIYIESLKE